MIVAETAGRIASLIDVSAERPALDELVQILTLRAGYNSTVVILGTSMLGLAAGVVGAFALLRRRAMMADALTHATLPGVAIAFLLAASLGMEGRSLPILLLGAAASGVLGLLAVQGVVRATRLTEDAAIGIVLSVFFGAGVVLLSLIQGLSTGNQGGLKAFIYGQTAAMHARDATLMAGIALITVIAAAAFYKELALVCFDDSFAKVGGWPVTTIDLLMMGMVVLIVVAGLQAVGLILVIALLIIPPAAARFWSDRLGSVIIFSALIGTLSGYFGAVFSCLLPRMPAGAVIVLTAGSVFFLSMLLAPKRGMFAATARRLHLSLRVRRDHLLRALYALAAEGEPATMARIAGETGESPASVLVALRILQLAGLASRRGGEWVLTDRGRLAAERLIRSSRLWERYLVRFADVAPSHVDWSADTVEHVLSRDLIAELERSLDSAPPQQGDSA